MSVRICPKISLEYFVLATQKGPSNISLRGKNHDQIPRYSKIFQAPKNIARNHQNLGLGSDRATGTADQSTEELIETEALLEGASMCQFLSCLEPCCQILSKNQEISET